MTVADLLDLFKHDLGEELARRRASTRLNESGPSLNF